MHSITVEFFWRVCCISAMIAVVGSTFGFDGELWLGGVSGVGDIDINESREGKLGGSVWVCWTEIVFDTSWYGYRCVHATSVEKGVN